jgi:hypothetical protein
MHLLSKEKNLLWKSIFRPSGVLISLSFLWVLIGELIAWICAVSVGARFKWFGTIQGIPFDNAVMVCTFLILIIGLIRYFRTHPDVIQNLYASLFVLSIWSILALFIVGENMMFFLPLCIGTLTLMLWKATFARVFTLVGMVILLIHTFSFIYVIVMALTIGALGLALFVAFNHLIVLIPLANGYLTDKASNRMP